MSVALLISLGDGLRCLHKPTVFAYTRLEPDDDDDDAGDDGDGPVDDAAAACGCGSIAGRSADKKKLQLRYHAQRQNVM